MPTCFMQHMDVLTGRLRPDARSLVLDEPLPQAVGKRVRTTLETIEPERPKCSHAEVLDEIHVRQRARGHVPPTKEEVDHYIEEERNS